MSRPAGRLSGRESRWIWRKESSGDRVRAPRPRDAYPSVQAEAAKGRHACLPHQGKGADIAAQSGADSRPKGRLQPAAQLLFPTEKAAGKLYGNRPRFHQMVQLLLRKGQRHDEQGGLLRQHGLRVGGDAAPGRQMIGAACLPL